VRIKNSVELKSDIDQYYRYGPTHRDHTCEFLVGCICRRVNQQRKEQNHERQLQHITDTLRAPAGAACNEDADGNKKKNKKTKKEKKERARKEKAKNRGGRSCAQRRWQTAWPGLVPGT